jgi:3-deoxy-7-phosphoheptulonate synthase
MIVMTPGAGKAEHADVVQIGARNMQNHALLEVAGRLGKPVLLKRGLSSSLEELLQARITCSRRGGASCCANAASGRSRRRRASPSTSARSEVHDQPEAALCDGPQTLGTDGFAMYVDGVAAHARLAGKELA